MQTMRTEAVQAKALVPWFLDVFLFPFNASGVTMMGILVGVPLAMSLLGMGLFALNVGLLAIFPWMISMVMLFFMFWYLGVCIRESGDGQTRAPEILGADNDSGLDKFLQVLRLFAAVFVCVGPAMIYASVQEGRHGWYWPLLAGGLFLLPMVLLSVAIFDSVGGFNPFRILWSIVKTLPAYCLVVLVFSVPVGLLIAFVRMGEGGGGPFKAAFENTVSLYLLMVACHILGRFYHRHEDRLDWF